uniref:DUF2946 domain-containing protein n=1 Tax=Eiseniibacteriota bacterium TaxID=2212470 RepID=A0A832MKF0_UNCEI
MTERLRQLLRTLPALALIGVLGISALAHFGHHALDPECAPAAGGTHPCVQCSALHAGAIVEDAAAPAPPAAAPLARAADPGSAAPRPAARRCGAPRAPPAA